MLMTKNYFFELLRHSAYECENQIERDEEEHSYREWLEIFLDWQEYSADNASLTPQYKTAILNSEIKLD
jgi:hypothetical protein